jgi:hypothetical protein
MTELIKLLQQLETSRFYGSIEIKMEAGRVTIVRKTESWKPTEPNYRNNWSCHEQEKH